MKFVLHRGCVHQKNSDTPARPETKKKPIGNICSMGYRNRVTQRSSHCTNRVIKVTDPSSTSLYLTPVSHLSQNVTFKTLSNKTGIPLSLQLPSKRYMYTETN